MPEVSPTPMFNATGLPVDPSTLIPGAAPRIHIAPPAAPGYFGASVNPGSQAQVPITTGYDTPPSPADKVRLAAAQVNAPPAQPGVPPAAAPPAPAGDTPSAVNDLLAQHDPAFDSFWARMVPGESGGKNVPNERYDATHTASGPA
ncbi:MAG TPA: hypothetical protein VLL82_02170, partial [Mycobacterium sp.]|nr:hypothetical protein [Mycobacterium sp.]